MPKTRKGSPAGVAGLGIEMARLCMALLVPVVVAGCASDAPPQQLSKACAVRACTCVDTSVAWWRKKPTTEPLWTVNGRAYCPEGYQLRLTDSR